MNFNRKSPKTPEVKRKQSASRTPKPDFSRSSRSPIHQILSLQSTIGNRAVQRLFKSGSIQTKLKIGQAGDMYEEEADQVAATVMRMPNPQVRRKPEKKEKPIPAKSLSEPKTLSAQTPDSVVGLGSQIRAINGEGCPLPLSVRTDFEPRFGQDFGQVRVHHGALASHLAQAVDARAFTVGSNIFFGAGQFAPETAAGKGLLAHELAHVVQQSKGPASDRSHADYTLQRQAAKAPPGPLSWANCDSGKINALNEELTTATDWVSAAINDLQKKDRPARTNGALKRFLTNDAAKITNTILPKLRGILLELKLGATNFRCQTEKQCRAVFPKGAIAYSGNPITLCPGFFGKRSKLGRITDMIHEAGHNAGLAGNVVEWQWPFPGLSEGDRLKNTESYAAFVRSNYFQFLPPYQQEMGVQVGLGALFPGGKVSPRFIVTAELDPVASQRILHYFDLRLGLRADVDTSGSIIGSFAVGTRLFSPVSLSSVPFFLDLRSGVVIGALQNVGGEFERIRGTHINLLGASGETRIGILQGNFGGSINYRYIWNLVKENPNLQELTISGEIRF